MCHNSCIRFGEKVFNKQNINGKSVLEVGSLNVNGSLCSVIEKYKPRTI
jgi:starvation-inducible outer membrane lipoprotein